jgi:quercetin dioxygenase-like cupin family protein
MTDSSIGKRIKTIRDLKEMELTELSSRTGLETDYLQSLEEDGIAPALGPLLKVSRALGTRLGTFIDDRMSKDPLVIRHSERQEEMGPMRGTDKPASLRFYSLGKGKTDRHMEPFFVEIQPGPSTDDHFSSHEGEEFIIVVSGQLQVIYGQETYHLNPGDSIYYNSVVPHSVSCLGEEPAGIYAVIYSP